MKKTMLIGLIILSILLGYLIYTKYYILDTNKKIDVQNNETVSKEEVRAKTIPGIVPGK